MSGAGSVDEWRAASAGLSRAEFARQHPFAFLVWVSGANAATSSPEAARNRYYTSAAGLPRGSIVSAPAPTGRSWLVIPLVKASGNPFPDRVTVGRAPNCDIVLRDASVSKLHGYFEAITSKSAMYTDAKSSNGSRLGPIQLDAGVSAEVRSQANLTFGRLQVRLLSSEDLYDWL